MVSKKGSVRLRLKALDALEGLEFQTKNGFLPTRFLLDGEEQKYSES